MSNIGFEEANRQAANSDWYYCLSKTVHGEEERLQHFHLHLMKYGSETWERHIVFRDFLRKHPDVARRYEEFKRVLAAKHCVDREGYTNAKPTSLLL